VGGDDPPDRYTDDRARAEQILLDAARRHTVAVDELPADALAAMQQRYFVRGADLEPRVYWRLTDNWLELTVRFLTGVYGVRDVKDAMSREVLAALDEAGIGLASATFEVVRVPPLRVTPGA
jgi:hypothetical protein